MTFQNLLTKQVFISRLTTLTGNRKIYATLTACLSEVQPLSLEKTNLVNGVLGKTFKMYVDTSVAISENDLIREVATGRKFKVKTGGVSVRSMGSIDYTEVIMDQVS